MKFPPLMSCLFGVIGLWFLASLLSWAGNPNQQKIAASEKTTGPTKFYSAVVECQRCHETPRNEDPPILCECNEYTRWHEKDVHQNAYKVLRYDRGTQIGRLMKKDVLEERTGCLHCHGVVDTEMKVGHEEGVSCVVCHGPYKEWVEKHWLDRTLWRDLWSKDKERQYGMTDLWDPVKRAEVCVSCHIGNGADKMVTHEMYAAGHPPLPGFALEAFIEFMPPHWEPLEKKWKRLENKPEIRKKLPYDPNELARTKSVVIGGMVAFLQTLCSFEEQAKACAQKGVDGRQMDLAHYDCYACHHELKKESWRQKRSVPRMTGRPQLPAWPLLLVTLGIRHAEKNGTPGCCKELQDKLERLQKSLESQPFGSPEEIASAARELLEWLKLMIKVLNDKNCRYDRAAAETLLRDLFECNKGKLYDYESGRQVFWAFRIIYEELHPNCDKDAEYIKLIKPLCDLLKPELRTAPFKTDPLIVNLANSLKVMSEYEPEKFEKGFRDLQKLVPHQETTNRK